MRRQLGALAGVFLAAHLYVLPSTLEDIDSINFALGVRHFDVAQHQPHPPGYPVFTALAKVSTGTLDALGVPAAAPRGLAILSALSGALLVPLLFALFRTLAGDPRLAWWATAVTVCSPLFWFSALRPLSDMTGLAFAVGAQVLLLQVLCPSTWGRAPAGAARPSDTTGGTLACRGPSAGAADHRLAGHRAALARTSFTPGMRIVAAAALAAVAAGVRSQTAMLTAPLLLMALVWPRTGLVLRDRVGAVAAAALGALAWGVPLVAASGGLSGYLVALGTQAGEDFSGVVMLWTSREPRVLLDAVLHSVAWPWGTLAIGLPVVLAAAAGIARAAWLAPRTLLMLAAAFGPYAVFHLLFHETITLRYALPLVPPLAFAVVYAAAALGQPGLVLAGAGLVFTSLALTLPASRAYARDGSPAFRLFEAIDRQALADAADSSTAAVGMHAVMRRVEDWAGAGGDARVLRARHGREWLALVAHWRAEPDATVHFVADPRRTDLALFDPESRRLRASERWTFPEFPFVAGIRPGAADMYTMTAPGWMLDQGWALTAEVGGVTAAGRLGPHVQPSVAWVRTRPEPAALIVGGRHLGGEGAAPVRLTLAGAAGTLAAWEVPPGPFFHHVPLPAGALDGAGYLPLGFTSTGVDGEAGAPVALEQFDLQSDGTAMFGFVDGWHEPEYNPITAQSWRWMSERARIWVRPVNRAVTLRLTGESPRRYFDGTPVVRASAAGVELARVTPSDDFVAEITLPAEALAASGGLIVLESDLWFTPAGRSGAADRRHLALRIYAVDVH